MPVNIKELRQERADLENEITEQKRLGRQLLNNGAGEDGALSEGQEESWQAIEYALNANESRLATVEQTIKRYERLQELRDADKVAQAVDLDDAGKAPEAVPTPRIYGDFGEQLMAIYRMGTNQATDKDRNVLMQMNAAAIGAGESVGADGGFLVQQDFANEIFSKMHEMGSILSRVRRQPVSGNGLIIPAVKETSRATGSRWGGVQGYWVGEGTAPTASQAQFTRLEFTLKKLAAVGYATDELLQDTTAMGMIFQTAFAEELTWLAENAIVNGAGAGDPSGILNADCTVSAAAETGQAATTIEAENIVNMWARLWARSRANAVWLINQDIEPQLFTMSLAVGTGGIPVYMPAGGLSQSPFGKLMGRPVLPVEYCATLGTVGDIILADLSQYMMIDKNGVRQDTSMHVRFLQDEMTFRAIYRVDGKPLWDSALTPANGSNTQSPFITLATRS